MSLWNGNGVCLKRGDDARLVMSQIIRSLNGRHVRLILLDAEGVVVDSFVS